MKNVSNPPVQMEKRESSEGQDDIESNLLVPAGVAMRSATLQLKIYRAEDVPQSESLHRLFEFNVSQSLFFCFCLFKNNCLGLFCALQWMTPSFRQWNRSLEVTEIRRTWSIHTWKSALLAKRCFTLDKYLFKALSLRPLLIFCDVYIRSALRSLKKMPTRSGISSQISQWRYEGWI